MTHQILITAEAYNKAVLNKELILKEKDAKGIKVNDFMSLVDPDKRIYATKVTSVTTENKKTTLKLNNE